MPGANAAVRQAAAGGAGKADEALARTLDEALDRIVELSGRLWDVREVHRRVAGRGLRRPAPRCADCGQHFPCATVRALDARVQPCASAAGPRPRPVAPAVRG